MYKNLKQFGKVKTNEPLAKHTTFKVGGPADFFVTVESTEKLAELLKYIDGEGTPYFILGGGSNVLMPDDGFRGVVIKIQSREIKVEEGLLVVDAGVSTVAAAQESIKTGFTGFEWGVGIPGTIGGALRGNAGSMGQEMKDMVLKVEAYIDGEIVEFDNEACGFSYRNSIFKREGGIILRIWIKLEKGDSGEAMKKALENLKYRSDNHPKGFGTAGCTFKNYLVDEDEQERIKKLTDDEKILETMEKYGKVPVGRLIELSGLKGTKMGNAIISEKHCNFIQNLGDAKASDILTLIEKVKEAVYNKFGVELEEEIQII